MSLLIYIYSYIYTKEIAFSKQFLPVEKPVDFPTGHVEKVGKLFEFSSPLPHATTTTNRRKAAPFNALCYAHAYIIINIYRARARKTHAKKVPSLKAEEVIVDSTVLASWPTLFRPAVEAPTEAADALAAGALGALALAELPDVTGAPP